jgi:hypothetical protein
MSFIIAANWLDCPWDVRYEQRFSGPSTLDLHDSPVLGHKICGSWRTV